MVVGVPAWQTKHMCTQKIVRGLSMARESSPLMSSKSAVIPECKVGSSSVPGAPLLFLGHSIAYEQFMPHLFTSNHQIPKYVILPVNYPLLPLVRQHTYVSEMPMGC